MIRNSFSNGGLSASGGHGSMHNGGTQGPSGVTVTGQYVGGVNQLRDDPTKIFVCA